MSEWRPIETAPKDWTSVLIYEKGAALDDGNVGEGFVWPIIEGGDDRWYWADSRRASPSHWMPLPEPPKEETE